MKKDKYLTIPQAAKILGISRIAVYKKVKNGQIKAQKVGRNYAIARNQLPAASGGNLTEKDKHIIAAGVRKTIHDFGEAIKLLGRE